VPLPSVRRILRFAPLFLFATACTDSAATGGMAAVVRDSAGVEIIEHSAELIATLPVWTVQGEPLVDIGGGEDPNEQFASVWGVVRLADGRIVVHDNRASELRLFSAEGKFIRRVAGAGEGPGEIRGAAFPHLLPGDTLSVTDQLRRTAYFAPDGRFVRQVTHPQPSLGQSRLGVFWQQRDGHVLGLSQPMMGRPESMSAPPERRAFPVVRVDPTGAIVDTLTMALGPPFYPVMAEEGGQTFAAWDTPLFSGQSHVVADDEQLVVGTNETNEIRIFREGTLRRILHNATSALPVTDSLVARYKAATLASYAEQRASEEAKRAWGAALERRQVSTHLRFYDRLTLGKDGSLWVQEPRPLTTDPYRFLVYGADGKAMARVELPERVRPWQMDRESVVGVWLDADDVPHVRVWRIGPAPR